MKKVKYYYNERMLQYEQLEHPLYIKIFRIVGFIAIAIVAGVLFLQVGYIFFPSANEQKLRNANNDLQDNYSTLSHRLTELQYRIQELEDRDNNVYRAIFEATPIPSEKRVKEIESAKEVATVTGLSQSDLVTSLTKQVNILASRTAVMDRSLDEVTQMVKNKEKMLACIPAIQPVSNKDLKRIASGFGTRIDPVYKIAKFHAGLDFATPLGTPIYATADATVKTVSLSGGYGKHVVLAHGYGYETLYGHMSKVKAVIGQHVHRGDVIGYVGSTGKSTGPHCHYEVHYYGHVVNPVYYFYNDITPTDYDKLLKISENSNQSLD